MRHALLFCLLALGGCVSARGSSAPVQSSIERRLVAVPSSDAIERIKAAFVREGLVVASVDGGTVTSLPAADDRSAMMPILLVYRALTISDSGGTRVIVTGTYQMQNVQAMQQAMTGLQTANPATALTSEMRGRLGAAWMKLVMLADAISTK